MTLTDYMRYAESNVPRIVFVDCLVTTTPSQGLLYNGYDNGTLIDENYTTTFDENTFHSPFTPICINRHSILYVYNGATFVLPIKKINISKKLSENISSSDLAVLDVYSGDLKTAAELGLSPYEVYSITEKTIYRLFDESMVRI